MSAYFELKNFCIEGAFRIEVGSAALSEHQWMVVEAPSGYGKTTLLRGIAGLEKSSGEVWLDGARIDSLPPHQKNIGIVFQDHLLFPHLTAAENIAYGYTVRGQKKEGLAEAEMLLKELDLGDKIDAPITVLSGGERQRVAILRALSWRPKLLILDEPFKGLDERSKAKTLAFLQAFSAQNKVAVILISHPTDLKVEGSVYLRGTQEAATGEATDVRKFHCS